MGYASIESKRVLKFLSKPFKSIRVLPQQTYLSNTRRRSGLYILAPIPAASVDPWKNGAAGGGISGRLDHSG